MEVKINTVTWNTDDVPLEIVSKYVSTSERSRRAVLHQTNGGLWFIHEIEFAFLDRYNAQSNENIVGERYFLIDEDEASKFQEEVMAALEGLKPKGSQVTVVSPSPRWDEKEAAPTS